MGQVQEAPFYDQHFREHRQDLIQSPHLGLYIVVYNWLKGREGNEWDLPIMDLGCGDGALAEILHRRGYRGGYDGYDFSETGLWWARRQVASPHYHFHNHDLRLGLPLPNGQRQVRTYTILETLEHLEDDVGLIEQMPKRTHVIFSVPNYDSEGHVRWFRDSAEVYNRYGQMLKYRRFATVDLSPPDGRLIHVVEGWRM